MIESGLGGLDRPCASLITLCASHLGQFFGQKLPKMAIFGYIGHKWVLEAPNGWNKVEQGWNKWGDVRAGGLGNFSVPKLPSVGSRGAQIDLKMPIKLWLIWPSASSGGPKWVEQSGINRPSWMYPTQIHLDPSSYCGLQGRLWPEFPDLWHFKAVSDPPGPPQGNFGGITRPSWMYPTRIQQRST